MEADIVEQLQTMIEKHNKTGRKLMPNKINLISKVASGANHHGDHLPGWVEGQLRRSCEEANGTVVSPAQL